MLDFFRTHLSQHPTMSFDVFMHHALYAPNGGYYTSHRIKLGKQGDFVTAPEISPLFGRTLANQCVPLLQACAHKNLLEFGAGSGRLCIDILSELERHNALPDKYYILEVSGGLQQLQQQQIQAEIPALADKVEWLQQWPQSFEGVMIANEVLDAMPVHRFLQTDQGLLQSYVRLNPQGDLEEVYLPEVEERLSLFVQEYLPDLPTPYQSEVNLFASGWIEQAAACLQKGVLLLIDYGFPRHEYYHPDRRMGTLMCHYQQQSHTNPLLHPGMQDITAHVDFTGIAEAAVACGMDVLGYTNQASFLLSNGLLSLIPESADLVADIQTKQAIKQFTHPHEMGELFKVMALGKAMDIPLQGFTLSDKRASL